MGRRPHRDPAGRRGADRGRHAGGRNTPVTEALVALLGGTLAAGTHFTQEPAREPLANTSPEPFSNWALSLGEDLFVVGLGVLALKYPLAAAVVVDRLRGADRRVRRVDREGGAAPTQQKRPLDYRDADAR